MLFLPSLAFATSTCLALTNAVPLQGLSLVVRNVLIKRTNPSIGEGIDITDESRGGKLVPREGVPASGAFSNTTFAAFTISIELRIVEIAWGVFYRSQSALIAPLPPPPPSPSAAASDTLEGFGESGGAWAPWIAAIGCSYQGVICLLLQ